MQYFLVLFSLLLAPWMSAAETELPSIRTGTWQQARPALTPRTEVTAAVLDDRIYVIGGFSPLRFGNLLRLSVSNAVEVYDPGKDRWYLVAPLPKPLHHAVAVVANQRLFVLGGFAPSLTSVWNPVNSVFEYLPSENRWRERRPMLTARGALAAAVLDGKIFAIGGYDGRRSLPVVEVYDLATDTWQSGAALATPRDHLAAVTVDNKIYAIGGRLDLDYKRNLAVVEEYDPSAGRWREVAPMLTARSGIAAAVLDGMVVVVGGESDAGTFVENEAYWPKTGTWVTLPPLPTPRHGLAAAVVRGRLYALCGGTRPGGSYSQINEVFTPCRADDSCKLP